MHHSLSRLDRNSLNRRLDSSSRHLHHHRPLYFLIVVALNYYHYGAPDSTASKYSGIDIRGEVLLLTRNILIHGQDIDGWGC